MPALSVPADPAAVSRKPGRRPPESRDRVVCLVRLILSFAGLLIAGQPGSSAPGEGLAGVPVLSAFILYSLAVYILALNRGASGRVWHWLDVAWGAAVLAAGGGGDSLFQLFFIFPVLVAAGRRDRGEGLAVLAASVAAALAAAALMPAPPWPLSLSRTLLLCLLGYAIVDWVVSDAQQKRRLALLQELSRVPNPRFGPDRLIQATLERLQEFYRAETCLAVLCMDGDCALHVAETGRAGISRVGAEAGELPSRLMALPDTLDVCVSCGRLPALKPRVLQDAGGGEAEEDVRAAVAELSLLLEARHWVSVRLLLRGEPAGRLYVLRADARFDRNDIRTLCQAGEQLMPLLETVQLLDGLATQAASKERDRLSLDMHDMTIQPYLGLKLGLECLRRKARPDNPLHADLDELYGMTNDSLAELRRYLRGMKGAPASALSPLLEGVQKQMDQFHRLYGIETEFNCAPELNLNDRLTAELLPMVGESLSNIGRHTRSRRVTLNIHVKGESLVCQTLNHGAADAPPWRPFTPVSLSRRAEQLGGRVVVDALPDNGAVVTVEIPL